MRNASDQLSDAAYDGCTIPPEVYEIGLGWDPAPEIDRLLFLARQSGLSVRSALELGCGAGRLLAAFPGDVGYLCGIELSSAMADLARRRLSQTGRAVAQSVPDGGSQAGPSEAIIAGDMTDFELNRKFDLIYTSANTIRHVSDDEALARFWRCVARHLAPGGVFIADTELGVDYERRQAGKPAAWTIARGEQSVRVAWQVVDPPSRERARSGIRWRFELESGGNEPEAGGKRRMWDDRFELRAFDAAEFVEIAEQGGLVLRGLYELRDPHLLERSPRRFEGRGLVVFGGN